MKRFGPKGSKDPALVYGVMPRMRMGEVTFTNVPVRFQGFKTSGNALVGLDLVRRARADVRPARGLRAGAKGRPRERQARRLEDPIVRGQDGVMVVKGDTMFPVGHPDVQQYFRVGKWTWDARQGTVVVDSVGVAPVGVANP